MITRQYTLYILHVKTCWQKESQILQNISPSANFQIRNKWDSIAIYLFFVFIKITLGALEIQFIKMPWPNGEYSQMVGDYQISFQLLFCAVFTTKTLHPTTKISRLIARTGYWLKIPVWCIVIICKSWRLWNVNVLQVKKDMHV